MSRSVKVVLAGQKVALRTDAKPKYVKELASYVSEKIDEVRSAGKTVTTQSLALMAAMQIADELFQARESELKLKRQVQEKAKKILRYLEREAEL